LREVVNGPTTARLLAKAELAAIKREQAEQRAAAAKADAAARMVAIKRAVGSLQKEYAGDVERFQEALATLSATMVTLNERYERLTEYEFEARDLGKDFGLPVPDFAQLKSTSRVLPPAELVSVEPTVRLLTLDNYVRLTRVHDKEREQARRTA
jgi:hypothetical protein